MKVKTFILGWTLPLSYIYKNVTIISSVLMKVLNFFFPHWVLCMKKKVFRLVLICSLTSMWMDHFIEPLTVTLFSDVTELGLGVSEWSVYTGSEFVVNPPPLELGEMKANCPLCLKRCNSVCTSDSKLGLEHLNLWLCARTLVFLLDWHVRHLELATRGRTSWSEFKLKFRPFLIIHFCFLLEKRQLERHNAADSSISCVVLNESFLFQSLWFYHILQTHKISNITPKT